MPAIVRVLDPTIVPVMSIAAELVIPAIVSVPLEAEMDLNNENGCGPLTTQYHRNVRASET